MQTTSTIKRTPAGVFESPVVIGSASALDVSGVLVGSRFSVSVTEQRMCQRRRTFRANVETVEHSHASYGWVAAEALASVIGGMGVLAVFEGQDRCKERPGSCSESGAGPVFVGVVFGPMLVGGAVATGVDLFKGGTKRSSEIHDETSIESFACPKPAGSGVGVSLVWPGLPSLSGLTDDRGVALIELGERRGPFELWVNGKPLRMIPALERQP